MSDADAAPMRRRAPSTQAERSAGLAPRALRQWRRAEHWMSAGEPDLAARALADALDASPHHPELLRALALVRHAQRRYDEASALLRDALQTWPDDALLHNNLGGALGEAGDLAGAAGALRRASELAPTIAATWFNLGHCCDRLHRIDEAERAYARALECDASHIPARLARAAALSALGRLDESAAEFRATLARRPAEVLAWTGLAGLRSTTLDESELAALGALVGRADLSADARIALGFAYGQALESRGRYDEAFAVFVSANRQRAAQLPWSNAALGAVVDEIAAAFSSPIEGAADPALGSEAIFLVGMPRSGSTLAEQILGAHPDVDALGESDALAAVIMAESTRRGVDFPRWITQASSADWERLGREYLARIAPRRDARTRSTDKTLTNWQLVGAAHAMLPGARFVDCRRDPLDTCRSCFTHLFASPLPFAYAFDRLASYWRDYDRLLRFWSARHPELVHVHALEALLDDPDAEIRRLLDACGLAFATECLEFQRSAHPVRTLSASQVRQPLARDAKGAGYGALFDPLRIALHEDRRNG